MLFAKLSGEAADFQQSKPQALRVQGLGFRV